VKLESAAADVATMTDEAPRLLAMQRQLLPKLRLRECLLCTPVPS
jgi:hypothetical protein